jgi:aspartate/tyrosine/aromatic aminotransferase
VITDAERVSGDALETMLSEIARELYFHPPDHAASIINILLASETLKEEWLLELSSMRNRIVSLRQKIGKSFQNERQTDFFSFLKNQNGMFSLLPISNEGIIQLRKKSGIYLMPDGRINIASVREDKIDYITSEICSLKEFQSRRV